MSRPRNRWAWCSVHGKRGYADPEAAVDALAGLRDGALMRAYPCTEHPPSLHVGHVTRDVQALDRIGGAL